ncbi:FkbM family methyltransferase [Candidatus Pelagibacter bacterium]|nr:FkbM family methyltransferase [Candidatus Pelagibacter bacterium]
MKKEYLTKSLLLFKLYLIYFGFKYKFFTKKKSYSQFGEDLVVNDFFKNFVGRYVDIGCYHPIKYNNTALLHKKGWKGVNIDLNQKSIDLFNACRKNDLNITACLSDKIEEVTIYLDSEFSALNSIYVDNSKNFKFKDLKKISVKTKIFPELIKDNFDFLNIDCEGNDFKILKTIDFKRYTPKIINIEVSLDYKKDIYNYMDLNGYKILDIKSLSHIFIKEN